MYDVIVVGGGPAGIAAALSARHHGAAHILIVDRGNELGGTLLQRTEVEPWFGRFCEGSTGQAYARFLAGQIAASGIELKQDTSVLEIRRGGEVACLGPAAGYELVHAKAIVLATGCRERARGEMAIPGDRPVGVMTAGAAQRMVNLEGCRLDGPVVILGSGSIGLAMAKRLEADGIQVLACVEPSARPYASKKDVMECLDAFRIPMLLCHTVSEIRGRPRVEDLVIHKVDADGQPIPGIGTVLQCGTLLLGAGLIPFTDLAAAAGIPLDKKSGGVSVDESMQTRIPGIFACGNAVMIHDSLQGIMEQSSLAGASAAMYALGIHRTA